MYVECLLKQSLFLCHLCINTSVQSSKFKSSPGVFGADKDRL